jgi:2-keto-4-pentenoate hydratase
MTRIDPRLASALAVQLESRRMALRGGAERVGWKLGIGSRERIGDDLVVGHLTSATRLPSGATYRAGGAATLCADAEVAVELGRDVDPDADAAAAREAVAGFGSALELVDLAAPPDDDAEEIVATNVFHRAFALGASRPELPPEGYEARLIVNGELRASAAAPSDFSDCVRAAARILGAVGERLQAGDWIITGSVVQVGLEPGDEVIAELGALGGPRLVITP